MSPMTRRSPSVQAPVCPSSAINVHHRRLRAAFALLTLAEKTASNPYLPPEDRSKALEEAWRHLGSAHRFLTGWLLDAGPSPEATRASELLGAINRGLPLIASELRLAAGLPISWDKDADLQEVA